MNKALIPGGYILLSRNLIESQIMSKPPLYSKVWIWLLLKAQHTNYKGLERGSYRTSIPEIIKAMTYKVGYRTEKPTKKQIFGIIEWLRTTHNGDTIITKHDKDLREPHDGEAEGPMMETTKVTHGFIYNIVNYTFYQNPKNYEGTNEESSKVTPMVETREQYKQECIKNAKNEEDNYVPIEILERLKAVKNYPLNLELDSQMVIRLESRYPDLDIVSVIDEWVVFKSDNPIKKGDSSRSQINTFCKNSVKWGNNQKTKSIFADFK